MYAETIKRRNFTLHALTSKNQAKKWKEFLKREKLLKRWKGWTIFLKDTEENFPF